MTQSNDKEFTVNISGDDWTTGVYTGTDTISIDTTEPSYTFDISSLDSTLTIDNWTVDPVDLNISYPLEKTIDPERVEKMCEQYPALRKAWDNFYSIYRMVDQDYIGNYEEDDEIPF